MKRSISLAVVLSLLATPGIGAPAVTTANVNFRAEPSTGSQSLGVLKSGTEVDLQDCDDNGSWCAVSVDGKNGFVSGRYLETTESDEDDAGWPRAFKVGEEEFVVLYQPQFSEWTDFTEIKALIAAEYYENKEARPVFGVIGVKARTERDSENGMVLADDVEVTSLDFGALDREALTALSVGIGKLLPTGPISLFEERIVASLASYQTVNDVEGLKADPPNIAVSTEPARLLITEGAPTFAPVKGAPGVEFAVNTNWDLFKIDDTLWLRDEAAWQTAGDIGGTWAPTTELPDALGELPDDDNWSAVREAIPAKPYEGAAPRIIHSEEPAELILFTGDPVFEDVPETGLEWASNTETDVFRLKDGGTWFILMSGRWFSAASLDGPWTFATPDLPEDFLNIPDDKPYYTVRASVPGTSESAEARLRASIPETARIDVATLKPEDVEYDGEPVFVPIEGTSMKYAENTGDQVIEVEGRYYLVQDGVWFVSDTPNGPWEVARKVPEVVYTIPPSSPVHNVTYVRIYKSEPDVVWMGYTTGYLFGYLAWGTLVYGTGWYYPPYWRYGRYPIYYPRPVTFGFGAYYNPAYGVYGRYGYAYGPYRGISARAVYNPRTGTYARGARVYGPYGSRGFVSAYNPRTGTRAVARGGQGVYGRWGSASVRRGSDYLRVRGGSGAGGSKGVRWDSSRGTGFAMSGRRGNVYAGRDGNVYRNTGDGWQKWGGGGWDSVRPPAADTLKRGRDRPAGDRVNNRPAGDRTRDRARTGDRRPVTDRTKRPATGQNRHRTATDRPVRQTKPRTGNRNTAPRHVGHDQRGRHTGNQRAHQRRQTGNRARAGSRAPTTRQHTGGRSRGGGGHRRRR